MTANREACRRCEKPLLRQSEFLQACRDEGLHADEQGRVALRLGNLAGSADYIASSLAEQERTQRAAFDRLESSKGYQCYRCDAVYCADCLMDHAPAHPRGGKACPSCGGTFGLFE